MLASDLPTVLSVFPSFAIGGAQMRFAALANRFPNRWRHRVIAMDGNRSAADRLAPGLDLDFPRISARNTNPHRRRLSRDSQPLPVPILMLTQGDLLERGNGWVRQ